jgi:hypothetical protein
VWDPHSGQLLATPFSGTEGPAISTLAIDPSGRLFAGSGSDAASGRNYGIAVIDVASRRPLCLTRMVIAPVSVHEDRTDTHPTSSPGVDQACQTRMGSHEF